MKTLYVDMDDVLCDYASAHARALAARPDLPYPQSVPGFFVSLEPMAGAIEGVAKLSRQFDVYVLTAPSVHNAHSYSEKRIWIERYFGFAFTEKLIICSNKALLKGEFLVDDHVNGKGQEKFEGRLIHFGSRDFPNWQAVCAFFDCAATR